MWSRKLLLLATLLLLAGCQTVQATPVATPILWTVEYTPALSWMGSNLNACMQQQTGVALVVRVLPAKSLQSSNTNFALRWGPPSTITGTPFVIGEDQLIFITNAENPVSSLSLDQLKAIYSGSARTWEQLKAQGSQAAGKIGVWEYNQGDDVQDTFASTILDETEPPSFAQLAPDPAAVIQAVQADKSAIGYIPAHWLTNSVHQVNLTGIDPATMVQPILALTAQNPAGAEKNWLICVKNQLTK